MLGRATIRLGIGPHSSYFCVAVTSYAATDGDSLAILLIDNERIAVSESPHTSKANTAGRRRYAHTVPATVSVAHAPACAQTPIAGIVNQPPIC